MVDGQWALTPEELADVERGHREFMKVNSEEVTPIRVALTSINQTNRPSEELRNSDKQPSS